MSTSVNSPDWETLNPMANEGTKLAVLEQRVEDLHSDVHGDDGISKRLREVEKTVWKAVGAAGFINLLVVVIIEVYKH